MAQHVVPEGAYMADFWACQSGTTRAALQRQQNHSNWAPHSNTIFRSSVTGQQRIKIDGMHELPPAGTVTVIENVSLQLIEVLGVHWGIGPQFFAGHVSDSARSPAPWVDVFGSSPADQKRPTQSTLARWWQWVEKFPAASDDQDIVWYVDGIIEYGGSTARMADLNLDENFVPRRLVHHATGGWHSHTRISCLVRNNDFYIILIDRPARPAIGPSDFSISESKLRFPVANNRGGLQISALANSDSLSILDLLQQFLSHSWHFDALFPSHNITPSTIFHLLACSTFKANLLTLEKQIKHISFHDIRRPSALINDRLHDKRRDLSILRTLTAMAKDWAPTTIRKELVTIKDAAKPHEVYIGFPDEMLADLLREIETLEKFLMDSFHLLISSTSVMEAEASMKQAVRAQKLTQLAFIYIPLSFVTGVFGMNLREINGSLLSIWVFVVTVAVTALCTVGVFAAFTWREKRKEEDPAGDSLARALK